MTGVEIALAAISTGMSVIGSIQQGEAQAAASRRAAQIADRNATIAQQDRQQDIQTADISAADKRRDDRRQYAAIRAAMGSSGLELAGTPLDVLTDTSTEMAIDEQRVSYEGQVRGHDDALRILGLRDQAATARMDASNASTAGFFKAGSALLSGTSKTVALYNKAYG